MKNKIMGIIIGIISGIIIFVSIINLLILYISMAGIWVSFLIQILNIILIIVTCLNYKKWKKGLVITIISISILSFIIPIKKGEDWKVINDTNPPGFYGGGFTTSEKYEIYYNIYGIPIFQKSTGETQTIG